MSSHPVAVIGGGPAGLMAAETLAAAGLRVHVYDAMPSIGRKFLLAGRGGLNLTHSEPPMAFVSRYGEAAELVRDWLAVMDASALRTWAHGLGIETFVGSSGRVFPQEMKAAPLLRAWLRRLRTAGVQVHTRHRWTGWAQDGTLMFETPDGTQSHRADAVVLALGGASWPRLGSDGTWQETLAARGVQITPLQPSNCGYTTRWTPYFAEHFAGQPLKSIAMAPPGEPMRRGECMITRDGLEGGLIYAWSAALRNALAADGEAVMHIDLLPTHSIDQVRAEVSRPRGARSWSSHLAGRLGLRGAKLGLLRECTPKPVFDDPATLAAAIKSLPLTLTGARPIAEAISTAGGVSADSINDNLMLSALPGYFCAGEMLDWDAPTGGYLLTACFASGKAAAQGLMRWQQSQPPRSGT